MSEQDMNEFHENIRKLNRTMGSYWLSLVRGLFTGFGSVLGAGLAILLIGWFLNVIGVIPAFQRSAEQWRQAFMQNQNQNNQTFVTPDNSAPVTATPAEPSQ